MGTVDGSASVEIEAPIAAVYAVAADVEGSPRWQPEIKLAECIERDGDGNQALVRMETEAKVRRLGRMLGMVIRGPVVGVLRGQLIDSMPEKLKRFVESHDDTASGA
jgi:hypothetical protein